MDFCIHESPAVKALGPLFKLTEVQLWDDGASEVLESPYFQESIKLTNGDEDYGKEDRARTNGFSSSPVDVELAREMSDLGLPLSFRTNKEMRYGISCGKRKGTGKNNRQSPIEIDDYMLDSLKESEEENRSPASVLNTSKMLDQSDSLSTGIGGLSNLSLEWGDSLNSTACTSTLSIEHEYNGEVSNLGFDDSFGCRSGLDINMLDEAGSSEMTAVTGLDCGTSEGSCSINEDADRDGTEIKGKLDSLHLEALLEMDHDTDGQSNDISLEVIKDPDVAAGAEFCEQANLNMINNYQVANSGEWIAYWDDFHMTTYFYNVETEESTWDPPPGMGHLVCGNIADEPTNTVAGLSELDSDQLDFRTCEEVQASSDLQSSHFFTEESSNNALSVSQQLYGISGDRLSAENVSEQLYGIAGDWLSADNVSNSNTIKKKKKVRRTKSNRISSIPSEGVLHKVSPSISKYWWQRYILFSRFDSGIKMDEEGWFSVTPEPIAKHHAVRCGHGAIVDFFTGVGGNAIQFAHWSKHVIAIDIDPVKIDYARHNAAIYGVDDRIDFIKGDSFSLAPKLKVDTVFMSPPWGGPAYSKVKKFDVNTMLKPRDGQSLFNAGKAIAPKMVMFLPRNVDINQLAELSLSATPPWFLEVERNFLNGRLKAITAYFSEPSMS